MMSFIPAIVVVGYNRASSLKRLLNSIATANYQIDEIPLIISIDHSESENAVLEVADSFVWEYGKKRIIKHDNRLGLRKHIISCGDLSEEYDAVIILEDDLIVAKDFYNYTLQAYQKYHDDPSVTGISLYCHAWNGYARTHFLPQKNEFDAFLGQFSITWGQSWSSRWWNQFKHWYLQNENKLSCNYSLPADIEKWGDQSWGKYFANYIVEKNLFYVVPYTSLSTNCSEVGEHTRASDSVHQVMLSDAINYRYVFPDYDSAVKYDIFFERILQEDYEINGIKADKICMDLNGLHRTCMGKEYIITSNELEQAVMMSSFGIELRPIEKNVINNVSGNGLFLYKVISGKEPLKRRKKGRTIERVKYEEYGISADDAIRFGINHYLSGALRRIRRMIHARDKK